jgi:hypothetical protein
MLLATESSSSQEPAKADIASVAHIWWTMHKVSANTDGRRRAGRRFSENGDS